MASEEELRAARAIVSGAIVAAGKMESSVAWRQRIRLLIPEVADILGEGSPEMTRALAMHNSTFFYTTFLGFDSEYTTHNGKPDRSNRLQVRLAHSVDKRHPDGVQKIRTERLDTPSGKRMAEKLKELKAGDEVYCWKVQEEMKSGDGETMAALWHIRYRPSNKDVAGATPSAPRPAPEEGRVTSSPSSGANPPVEMEAFIEATKDWPGKTVVALKSDLDFAGLWPPTTDNVDRMIAFVKEWRFE